MYTIQYNAYTQFGGLYIQGFIFRALGPLDFLMQYTLIFVNNVMWPINVELIVFRATVQFYILLHHLLYNSPSKTL